MTPILVVCAGHNLQKDELQALHGLGFDGIFETKFTVNDRVLITGWIKHDYDDCKRWAESHELESDCDLLDPDDCECFMACRECEIRENRGFDSGVVVVFTEDCFSPNMWNEPKHAKILLLNGERCQWNFEEANELYILAHQNHVRCVSLTELQQKRILDECEAF